MDKHHIITMINRLQYCGDFGAQKAKILKAIKDFKEPFDDVDVKENLYDYLDIIYQEKKNRGIK